MKKVRIFGLEILKIALAVLAYSIFRWCESLAKAKLARDFHTIIPPADSYLSSRYL
jgi:hypothetical protein